MSKIKKINDTKCWWGFEDRKELGLSGTPDENIKWYTTLEHGLARFLKKLSINLPYNPDIPLLDIYSREFNVCVHVRVCTWMFITSLFVIAPNWEDPNCPAVGKLINKSWYICPMEYYSATKEVNVCYTQWHSWISKSLFWVKKARKKSISYMILLRKISRKFNLYSYRRWISGYLRMGGLVF